MTLDRVCQRCNSQGEILGCDSPDTEKLPSSGSQGNIRASKVVDGGLG